VGRQILEEQTLLGRLARFAEAQLLQVADAAVQELR